MESTVLGSSALFLIGGLIACLLIKPNAQLMSVIFLLGSILLCAGGMFCWSKTIALVLPPWLALGWLPIDLRCDTLSAFFLTVLGVVSAACALFSGQYIAHLSDRISARLYWSCLFLFMLGMVLVLLAANAPTFLVAWELMSLSSAVLVASEYQKQKAQSSAFIYLVATRVASVFLTAGFLLMFAGFHDISFSSWTFSARSTWFAATLILLGLIIKAGIWPFHIWLAYAHPEAPSPISALMSGVMIKLPVYAALRFFLFGNLTCPWLPYVLLALSAVSAFWGVLFALNQRELKRLLAYSSVENISLIFISLSLALLGKNAQSALIGQIALIAVLMHVCFHALFKSLLFLGAGSVDFSSHTRDLSKLGGLGKRMPTTFATFVIGSAAICALPPLNGFASKWSIYQALLHCAFGLPDLFSRAICVALIGVLGGIGALAVASFVKALGVTFLGKPRSAQASVAHEVPPSMQLPQIALAAACILSGIFAPFLVTLLNPISISAGFGRAPDTVFQSIPLAQLAVVSASLVAVIYVLVFRRPPDRFETWDCGFGTTTLRSQVSADSFAQPIARIFTPVLQYHLTIDISGHDRRHFPEKIVVEPSMVSLLETRIYGPLAWLINKCSQLVAKLQTGSIHLYLSYMCVALIVLLALGARL